MSIHYGESREQPLDYDKKGWQVIQVSLPKDIKPDEWFCPLHSCRLLHTVQLLPSGKLTELLYCPSCRQRN